MRRLAVVLSVVAVVLMIQLLGDAGPAAAHPLGNFTVNRLAKLTLLAGGDVELRYVLDMAEIRTIEEMRRIDTDRSNSASSAELASYASRLAQELLPGLGLMSSEHRVILAPIGAEAVLSQGQGGLSTLRISIDYEALNPGGWQNDTHATFTDDNYANRIGWRQIVVLGGEGVAIADSTAIAADETAELTAYPSDRLQSPPNMRQVTFRFSAAEAGTEPLPGRAPAASGEAAGPRANGFTARVADAELTPLVVAVSLFVAMAWGAAHALGPGHGKTIVAAYLVGSRGTPRQALLLGVIVTVTHTSSVVLVGVATWSASSLVSTQDLYVWLSVASGLMIVAMGALLFVVRLRSYLRGRRRSRRETVAEHFHDTHGHDHAHGHSHASSSAQGARGLIALGISGGLLPCPTALVVMLGAIALDRVVYGLALVGAFGVGLASVLTAVGLLFVYANRFMGGRSDLLRSKPVLVAMQVAPVLGALVILGAGLLMTRGAVATLMQS